MPWTSFAPKCSATCATGIVSEIQYALMFGMLSSSSRETASIFRSAAPVVELEAAALEDGVLRMEGERDEREEAARLVLLVAQAQQVVDPLLVGLDVAVEQRAVRRDASRCAVSWTWNQMSGCSLPGATRRRTRSAKISAPPPGSEPRPGRLELAQHLLVREAGERRHVVDLATPCST